jgi:geranylgeranylglycerol-phosphate geranylgeranyltransferase
MIALAIFTSALVGVGLEITSYAVPVSLAMVIAFLFGIAANAINDYFDQETDKVNHPERPIPAGRITPNQALTFSISFFIISMMAALFLSIVTGYEAFLIVTVALVFQISYEKKLKHTKIVGNAVIGTQTALAFLFGGAIVEKSTITGILAIAAFVSVLGREIVKDIEDVKGDFNKATLPMEIGIKNAGIIASFLIISAIFIGLLPYYPFHIFGLGYLLIILMADALFIYSIPILFSDPKSARKALKGAMLIALFAFIVGSICK